ncbi:hypothetical protein [Microcoleus sp. herbarium5]|uniref:hypothetical protein n=1 Tax=Microcoleus sp. herbarium5 TaxID=3055434 RepID=UPI002FCF3B17
MPTDFVSVRGDNYVADRGEGTAPILAGDLISYRTRFNRPPGMSTTAVDQIVAALEATQTAPGETVPCEGGQIFEPRRLKFTFANKGSISIPAPNRERLITLATDVRGILETTLGINVVCVSLIGEEWKRLDQDLRPTGVVPTPGDDIRPTAGTKNPVYTAAISYESDSGRTFVEKIRMNTNVVNSPFSRYATAIGQAIGTPLPRGCGSATNVKPRHYEVAFLTNSASNPVRKLIIPVADDDAADIQAVGVALATNPQTLCLKYYGESDSRFSRILP